MIDFLIVAIAVTVVVGVMLFYLLAPRYGPHYTSRLTCPKCGETFDYRWVPFGSFSAVRLGTKWHLSCPHCHEWTTYEIWSTRIKNNKS